MELRLFFYEFSWTKAWSSAFSPLLFVVFMELSRMLNATMNQGLLTGFFVGSKDNEDYHLLFADDTLIFCGAKSEHL